MSSQPAPAIYIRRAYLARRRPADTHLRLELVLHRNSAPLPAGERVVLTFRVTDGGEERYREVRRFTAQHRDMSVIAIIMEPEGSRAHLLALTKKMGVTTRHELKLAIGTVKLGLYAVYEGSRAYAQEDGPPSAAEN